MDFDFIVLRIPTNQVLIINAVLRGKYKSKEVVHPFEAGSNGKRMDRLLFGEEVGSAGCLCEVFFVVTGLVVSAKTEVRKHMGEGSRFLLFLEEGLGKLLVSVSHFWLVEVKVIRIAERKRSFYLFPQEGLSIYVTKPSMPQYLLYSLFRTQSALLRLT